MVFCGQCGLLIPPGSTKCPRCGAPVDENPVGQQAPTTNDINNETQVSMQAIPQHQPGQPGDAYSARTQQDQRGYQTYSNNNAPTSAMPSSTRPTPAYPAPPPHTSNPYNPVSPSPYPYRQQQEGYTPPQPAPYYQPQPPRRGNGLLITLITLAVLLVLVTGGILLAGPGRLFPNTANNTAPQGTATTTNQPTDTATTQPTDTPEATATPTQTPQTTPTPTVTSAQAEGVVYKYYNYINAQQYQQAYATWAHINQTYDDFKNGFSTTAKDTIQTIRSSDDPQGQKVSLTLQALSTDGQTTMYSGYYIVSQQADGSPKFVDGQMNKVS